MNDLVRDKLTNQKGEIALWAECVAGGTVSVFGGRVVVWKYARFHGVKVLCCKTKVSTHISNPFSSRLAGRK